MPEYKCTFIFNYFKYGWSETWYLLEDNIDLAMTKFKALGPSRSAVLATGADIEAVRVVDTDSPRGGLVEDTSGKWPGYEAKADTPWNSIRLTAVVAGYGRRNIWLRGIPDSWIVMKDENGKNVLPDVGKGFIQAFIEYAIQTTRVRMKVLRQDGQNTAGVDITALGAAVNGNLELTVAGSTAAVGEIAGMKKWKGPDQKLLNKRYTVSAIAAGKVTVRFPFTNLSAANLNSGGKLYTKKTQFLYITSMKIQQPARRATGRAFFAPRGRQSKRVC